MEKATDFLDAVKARHSLRSDYQLAKYLSWNQQRITKIRGGATFDDDAAAQIADVLDLDPGYVAACMAGQRAQSPEARRLWERAAKKLLGAAAMIALSCAALLTSSNSFDISLITASSAQFLPAPNIHYAQLAALALALLVIGRARRIAPYGFVR